jgi:hypothetical protein
MILVSCRISVPTPPFDDIIDGKFPPFGRIVQSRQESSTLFLSGEVQMKLEHNNAVAREMTLERANIGESNVSRRAC